MWAIEFVSGLWAREELAEGAPRDRKQPEGERPRANDGQDGGQRRQEHDPDDAGHHQLLKELHEPPCLRSDSPRVTRSRRAARVANRRAWISW